MFLCVFNSLDSFQTYSDVLMIYYEYCYMNKFLKFNIKLNYHLKNMRNQAFVTLAMVFHY